MIATAPGPRTAQELAYVYVRDRILSGQFPGGSRLNLDEVAEALGTSRMPVREAIRRLDTEGLVTILPHRGAVVTRLTPRDILELFEMRAELEALAVRHAVPRIGVREIDDLKAGLARLDAAREDPKSWLDRHDEFHDRLCGFSDRPRLTAEIRRLRTTVRPYLLLYLSLYRKADIVGYEHQTIVETVERDDIRAADEAIRGHIIGSASYVVEFLERMTPTGRSQDLT